MTFYQYINGNIERIRSEIKIGLIPPSILRHWEIYSRFDLHRRMGSSIVDSVSCASYDMRVSERVIFRIIKKMQSKI